MQEDEYQKIDAELEPFKVDGKITKETQLKWLQLKGVIRISETGEMLIKPDKKASDNDRTTCHMYENMCELLEKFMNYREKVLVGKMGTKKVSDIIKPEDLPF